MTTPNIYDRVQPWLLKPKFSEGEYGVEIETETKDSEDYPDGFLKVVIDDHTGKKFFKTPKLSKWIGHFDNSLRNYGVEFVFKEPYSYKDAIAALDQFGEATKKIPFIQNAPSTSVHVHWNVLRESFLTMANFLALYALYENLLISYCGPLRRSNLFALPIRVAEKNVELVTKMLSDLQRGNTRGMIIQDFSGKYGALNVSSLCRLGSFEVRSMRGTTNVDEIKEWLGIINQIVTYARTPSLTPSKIVDLYRDDAPELFHMTFGPYADALRKAGNEDPEHGLEYLVEKNLWYLKEIAESVNDWSTFNTCMDETYNSYKAMTKPQPKKLKVSAGSMGNTGWNDLAMYTHAVNELSAINAAANAPINTAPAPAVTIEPMFNVDDVDSVISEWQDEESNIDNSNW